MEHGSNSASGSDSLPPLVTTSSSDAAASDPPSSPADDTSGNEGETPTTIRQARDNGRRFGQFLGHINSQFLDRCYEDVRIRERSRLHPRMASYMAASSLADRPVAAIRRWRRRHTCPISDEATAADPMFYMAQITMVTYRAGNCIVMAGNDLAPDAAEELCLNLTTGHHFLLKRAGGRSLTDGAIDRAARSTVYGLPCTLVQSIVRASLSYYMPLIRIVWPPVGFHEVLVDVALAALFRAWARIVWIPRPSCDTVSLSGILL